MHDGVGQESGVWELERGLEILGTGRLINNEPRITKSELSDARQLHLAPCCIPAGRSMDVSFEMASQCHLSLPQGALSPGPLSVLNVSASN